MSRCWPLVLLLLAGCGGSVRTQAEVDRGKQALVAALDNWKNNEPATKLKSLSDAVEFSEELRKNHELTEYTIGTINSQDAKFILVTVALKLKDRKGKQSEREVVYSVELSSPVRVLHDPHY